MFRFNKLVLIIGVFFIGFVFGNLYKQPLKTAIKYFYQDEFNILSYKCDNAMREHFLAKAKLVSKPSKKDVKNLQASELALLDCHSYDKFRKKLLTYGLNENDLAQIFLNSMENNKTELQKFVKEHEIRF